jgi:hypothetical protein
MPFPVIFLLPIPKRISWRKESAATKTFYKKGKSFRKGSGKTMEREKLVTVKDGRNRA